MRISSADAALLCAEEALLLDPAVGNLLAGARGFFTCCACACCCRACSLPWSLSSAAISALSVLIEDWYWRDARVRNDTKTASYTTEQEI
jgi:hypothetical protein